MIPHLYWTLKRPPYALEDTSETRDKITIHTDSLTAVNILHNRTLDLNTITRAIREAASRLTQMPTINWIPAHTGIPGNERQTRPQREAYNSIEYTLLLRQALSEYKQEWKNK